MSDIAIRAEGLTKQYRIGRHRDPYRTLRDVVARGVAAPFRRRRAAATGDGEGTIWALEGVSFEIPPGKAWGIIGPNGAGKSTLLKVLSRITEPTGGFAEVRGRVGSLLEVGTGFHPEMTGRENIFLNGAVLGMRRSEIKRKFDEIVAFAEVEKFLDTPIKHYSSGMYVRLAFAVAAHLEFDILIVDEVLAVGDYSFQKKCLGRMEELSTGRGRTVLFVSHNLASIRALTDSCIWMHQGKIRAAGRSEAIVNQYLSLQAEGKSDGVADLSGFPAGRAKRDLLAAEVTFHTVRLLNGEEKPTSHFLERTPIVVELTFQSRIHPTILEILCRIRSAEGTIVFTCLSGKRKVKIQEGPYRTSVLIDPNPLRPGRYVAELYMLTGVFQDMVPSAIAFDIEANVELGDDPRLARENLGVIRVDYPWADIVPV